MYVPIQNRVGLYAQGLNIITGPVVDAVKRIDPDLVVVLNRRSMQPTANDSGARYEIYDRAAPGGARWQLAMRVQEPDGSYRELDGRVLDGLRRARRPVSETIADIERQEAAHDALITKEARAIGEDLYDDVKWMGRRVMGHGGNTVAWQARSDPTMRERIRAAA